MSDTKLGQKPSSESTRDAIHVAIIPLVARDTLRPGEHVEIDSTGRACCGDNPVGVVDPFLKGNVLRGERFWLCLYQGTATGMRHHWDHPSFPDAKAVQNENDHEDSDDKDDYNECARCES